MQNGVIIEFDIESRDCTLSVYEEECNNLSTTRDLKPLNKYVTYNDFKMESLKYVFYITQPDCWLVSLDLKDSF